ncbi:MAG: hypothetical protein ACO3LE_09610 [Bdellovibrionota bacterium]
MNFYSSVLNFVLALAAFSFLIFSDLSRVHARESLTSKEAISTFLKLREKIAELDVEDEDLKSLAQARLESLTTELSKDLREFLDESIKEIISSLDLDNGDSFSTQKTYLLLMESLKMAKFSSLELESLDEQHEIFLGLFDHFEQIGAADQKFFLNEVINQMAKNLMAEIQIEEEIDNLINDQIQSQLANRFDDEKVSVKVNIDADKIRDLGPEFSRNLEDCWVNSKITQLIFLRMAQEMWPSLSIEVFAAREIAVASRSMKIWFKLDFLQGAYDHNRMQKPFQAEAVEQALENISLAQ